MPQELLPYYGLLNRAKAKAESIGWHVVGFTQTGEGTGIVLATKTTDVQGVPCQQWVTWDFHHETLLSCGRYTNNYVRTAVGDYLQRVADCFNYNYVPGM